jgi:ribosomal-protein-alanine N-acetyltransferase
LKKEFWGKGYGSLICQELLVLAEKTKPGMNIIGNVDPENMASKRHWKRASKATLLQQ